MVEHRLAKAGVAGSNPVFRSNYSTITLRNFRFLSVIVELSMFY